MKGSIKQGKKVKVQMCGNKTLIKVIKGEGWPYTGKKKERYKCN